MILNLSVSFCVRNEPQVPICYQAAAKDHFAVLCIVSDISGTTYNLLISGWRKFDFVTF